MVLVGLLKRIKGRRACLPLAHRFYLPKKAIASKSDNMAIPGEATLFQAKPEQATEMLAQLADHFVGMPIADHASMEHDWACVLKRKAARLKTKASCRRVFLYGRYRDVMATTNVVMLKTLKPELCSSQVCQRCEAGGMHLLGEHSKLDNTP